MEWKRMDKNRVIMRFPTVPYLNQKFNPNPDSTICYIWTGFAWDLVSDPLEFNLTVKKTSYEINGEVPIGEVNGVNKIFNLSQTPISGTDSLYLGGLRQLRDIDYLIDSSQITLAWAPLTGMNILCNYEVVGGLQIEGEIAELMNEGEYTRYSLNHSPAMGTEKVYINGLRVKSGENFDYTLDNNIIKINYQLFSNSRVVCDYNY